MRVPKTALYTTIGVFALLAVFIGGGAAYIWYTGQQDDGAKPIDAAPTAAKAAEAGLTPSKPSADARPSAAIEMLTSPVTPGENASLTVQTVPTSMCTVKVEYNHVLSTDSGLVAKKADAFGTVSWTWTVEKGVPRGTWPVTATCVYNGRAAVVQGDLQVTS